MEEKFFLVQYLNHSKKLLNPTLKNIKELFGITDDLDIFIQYFDSEFQSFIDTSWDELKYISSNKLRVCIENHLFKKFSEAKRLKATCDEPAIPFEITEQVPIIKQEFEDTNILELCEQELIETSDSSKYSHLEWQNAFCQSKNSCINDNLDELSSASNSHSSGASGKVYNNHSKPNPSTVNKEYIEINSKINKPVTYGNLDSSFVLPYINPRSKLWKSLTGKENLSKGLKSELLSKIYESFANQKIFYIGRQSIQVVNALLNAYPHLGKNMPYESAKRYWLRSLNFKFTNERVRTDFAEETVIASKANNQQSKSKSSKCSSLQSEDDEDNLYINSRANTATVNKEYSEINSNINKPVTYGNLDSSYVLPYIHPRSKLGKSLAGKENLSRSLKSELLSKIYESFATQKIFYIGRQSIQVVHALLNAYPHLGKNMPYASAKHYWLRSLNFKFTNERKRTDFAEETVIASKANNQQSKLKGSSCCKVPNYYPLQSEDDEDNLAIEAHIRWMKAELKKHSRNESAISTRMNLTFRDRRCRLFKDNDANLSNFTASDLLEQYPCLSIEKEAILEVNRLFGESKFYEKYCNIIHSLSECFYEHLLSTKCKYKSHVDSLFSSSNSLLAEEQKLLKLPAIISTLLSENPKEIIDTEWNESHAPMLKIVGDKISLNVDGNTFIEEVSAINATYLWTGAFYIFNVKPTQNRKTFQILQKIIFDLPEVPKWTHTHLKVMNICSNYLES